MKVFKISIISKSTIIFLLIVSGFASAQSNDIRNADPVGFPDINKKSNSKKNNIHSVYGNSIKFNSTISGVALKSIYIVNDKRTENLNAINPNKINSITVYKDKKAIELYGEEAKNGVIVIEAEKYYMKRSEKDLSRDEIILAI